MHKTRVRVSLLKDQRNQCLEFYHKMLFNKRVKDTLVTKPTFFYITDESLNKNINFWTYIDLIKIIFIKEWYL